MARRSEAAAAEADALSGAAGEANASSDVADEADASSGLAVGLPAGGGVMAAAENRVPAAAAGGVPGTEVVANVVDWAGSFVAYETRTSGVWVRLMPATAPPISDSRVDLTDHPPGTGTSGRRKEKTIQPRKNQRFR